MNTPLGLAIAVSATLMTSAAWAQDAPVLHHYRHHYHPHHHYVVARRPRPPPSSPVKRSRTRLPPR